MPTTCSTKAYGRKSSSAVHTRGGGRRWLLLLPRRLQPDAAIIFRQQDRKGAIEFIGHDRIGYDVHKTFVFDKAESCETCNETDVFEQPNFSTAVSRSSSSFFVLQSSIARDVELLRRFCASQGISTRRKGRLPICSRFFSAFIHRGNFCFVNI